MNYIGMAIQEIWGGNSDFYLKLSGVLSLLQYDSKSTNAFVLLTKITSYVKMHISHMNISV